MFVGLGHYEIEIKVDSSAAHAFFHRRCVGRTKHIDSVRGETDKKAVNIQARSFMARTLDEIGKKCQAEGEAKVVN